MTDLEFLSLLNVIDFPRLYWEFCDRFPLRPGFRRPSAWKEAVVGAFQEEGINPSYVPYDRCFVFEEEQIGDFTWHGTLCMQKSDCLELIISGKSEDAHLGTNLAGLAYDAKRLADPTFKRDRFAGPPLYPRPAYNGDLAAIRKIVREFVVLVRLIKNAIRRNQTEQHPQ